MQNNKTTFVPVLAALTVLVAGCSGSSTASSNGSGSSNGGTSSGTGGTSGGADATLSPQLFTPVAVQASPGFSAGAILQISSAPIGCGVYTSPDGGQFTGELFDVVLEVNGGVATGTYPEGQATFSDGGTSVAQINGYVIDGGQVVGGFGVWPGGTITLTDVSSGLTGSIQGPFYMTYDFPDGGVQVVDAGALSVTFNAPWCR